MRVLLLFPHFETLQQASSLRSWQIGRYLVSQGHEVIAFAPGVDLRTEQLFPEVKGKLFWEDRIDGVRVLRPWSLPHFRRSPFHRLVFEFLYAVLVFLRSLFIRKIDVIVASYPPALMPPFGLLLAWLRRKPLVFEVRDLMATAVQATGYVKSGLFTRLAQAMEHWVARYASWIIAASPGVKRQLIERGMPKDKISSIPHGYESSVFSENIVARDVRSEFGWNGRFVVIYAGAVTHITDFPSLFAAAERLREHPRMLFVIVGEGVKRQHWMEHCATHGLQNCQFLGNRPRGEIGAILSGADVGINLFPDDPVWSYMLGSKLFDYYGARLPVVYAGRGDAADVIRESQGGIVVEPEDAQAFAEALLWLEEHRATAREMGARGNSYVIEHFSGDRLLAQYDAVLCSVVDDKMGAN